MEILAVIPARYHSTRFPGKPLVDIGGKTMIQRVYEQVKKASHVSHIVIATDDDRIAKAASAFGAQVVMTSAQHPSGTDRCAEALDKTRGEFGAVINIQGDEPFIRPEQIDQVALLVSKHNTEIATLSRKITRTEDIFDSSKVKLVTDSDGRVMYFSRSPIPFNRQYPKEEWLQHADYYLHVGIYGYTTDVLKDITQLRVSSLEETESLEQLRWLQNGYTIHANVTSFQSYGIDTPADLEKVQHLIHPNG